MPLIKKHISLDIFGWGNGSRYGDSQGSGRGCGFNGYENGNGWGSGNYSGFYQYRLGFGVGYQKGELKKEKD